MDPWDPQPFHHQGTSKGFRPLEVLEGSSKTGQALEQV